RARIQPSATSTTITAKPFRTPATGASSDRAGGECVRGSAGTKGDQWEQRSGRWGSVYGGSGNADGGRALLGREAQPRSGCCCRESATWRPRAGRAGADRPRGAVNSAAGEGQQSHLAGVLDRHGDLTLLLRGQAGDAARTDLA